eukprot:TRINITY_DN18949_c0_g2_i1.p1 TRINITY_DN18949_c0_g2~~TRINITY_DN18949_c0_g2_i1.p1  ORF type:complete len:677 (+),score=61.09 TRINITY_DN18949_c0_g2_i1:51-2081(+)
MVARNLVEDLPFIRTLPHYQQCDYFVRHFATWGNLASLPLIGFHMILGALNLALFWFSFGKEDEKMAANGNIEGAERLFQNTLIFTNLLMFLGTSGGYHGPIYGEPTFRFIRYRFSTDIPKASSIVWRKVCEIGLRGNTSLIYKYSWTRTWVDVLHTWSFIFTSLLLLVSDDSFLQQSLVLLYAVLYALFWLLDPCGLVATYGWYHYMCFLPWAFVKHDLVGAWSSIDGTTQPGNLQHKCAVVIPHLQIYVVVVYFCCGFCKMGPWWEVGFAQEWTGPAWAYPLKRLSRGLYSSIFYKVPPSLDSGGEDTLARNDMDMRITPLGRFAAHFSGFVEMLAPILLLCGGGIALPSFVFAIFGDNTYVGSLIQSNVRDLSDVGLYLLYAMHFYIVFHFAHADVNVLNWMSVAILRYAYVHAPAHDPLLRFSLKNLQSGIAEAPWLYLILLVDALKAIYGQIFTDSKFLFRGHHYAFWSGNYNHGFYLFSESGRKKLQRQIDDPSSPLHKLGPPGMENLIARGLQTKEQVTTNNCRFIGALWCAQWNCKVFPLFLEKALKVLNLEKLTDVSLLSYQMTFNMWLFGLVAHEMQPTYSALEFLKKHCEFDEHECVYAGVSPFPSVKFRDMRYFIVDLGKKCLDAKGDDSPYVVIESGQVAWHAVRDLRKPSDMTEYTMRKKML